MFSKRICVIATILTVLIFSANVFAEAESAPKVGAREPLTYRNMGIYGWWQPYFWEGPFDFLIVQGIMVGNDGNSIYKNVSDSENLRLWNESLMKARAAGKRVIVDIQHAGVDLTKPLEAIEDYYHMIDTFLSNVNADELYAITIGEEHIFWDGRHELLEKLYYRIKKKYPDVPVYQWYSPTSRGTDWPGFIWPWLPADGWMIDEYHAEPLDFEQNVRHHLMLGVPLVHIVWAAPNVSNIPFHQSVFEGQLRVAQKYNVPCSFFCWEGPPKRTIWGWDENAQEHFKKVFGFILDAMEKAKKVPEKDMANWDVGRPLETVLEKGADGKFSYRESYDLRMKETGYKFPKHTFMKRSRIKGLRNMKWVPDPSRIIIRSDGTGPVDASLTNRWSTPNGERCRFSASAKIKIEPQASVDVIFEVSPNGYDWVAKTTRIKDGVLQLKLTAVHTELYTRLRVSGKSAKAGTPLASIDWIEVRGNIAK